MNAFLELPAEITCDIVGKWLYLEDITRLDSAFCQSELRTVFHSAVLHSPLCVLADAPHKFEYYEAHAVHWFVKKGIRTEVLPLSRGTIVMKLLNYLHAFGYLVKFARFENMPYEPHKIAELSRTAVQYCTNLTSIVWSNCDISEPLIVLLLASTKLTYVFIPHSDSTFPLERIPATHHLRITSLDMICKKEVETMVLNMCALESIQKLHLVYLDTRDWSKFTNLRSLQIHVGLTNSEQYVLQVFQNCPLITNLDLSESSLTDELLTKIITPLRQLRTLNIENTDGLTDIGLLEVANRLKGTLEALYTKTSSGVTAIGINHVLKVCTKLHTISFTAFCDIDYALVSKISTLVIDRPADASVYASISQHCHNVHTLHVLFPCEEETTSDNMDKFITLACALSSLRNLFVVDLFSLFDDVERRVNSRRPTLFVTDQEEEAEWYDLFSLPI